MSQKAIAALALAMVAGFAGCASTARAEMPSLPTLEYATFTDADAEERLAPGDEVEITVYSAPELSRTVKIGPDGRVRLPMAAPVMAAERTANELTAALVAALSVTLRDPMVEAMPKFGARQVFVGGEVARPGVYEVPAGADALQAVMIAGGFTRGGKMDQVALLRRAPGGEQHAMLMDLTPKKIAAGATDAPPLRRMDVIIVPKRNITAVNQFVQEYIRDAMPITFSASYNLGESWR
jgi:polysaccharide export outer membrane protein